MTPTPDLTVAQIMAEVQTPAFSANAQVELQSEVRVRVVYAADKNMKGTRPLALFFHR